MADKQSQSYHSPTTTATAAAAAPSASAAPIDDQVYRQFGHEQYVSAATNQKCFFCGYKRHPRSQCPAREASCKNCGENGHFAKVCKSSKQKIVSSAMPDNFHVIGTTMSAGTGTDILKQAMIEVKCMSMVLN